MLFPVAEVMRSLSNLIKYPFVDMRGKESVVVSYEKEQKEDFVPLNKSSKVIIKTLEEVEQEELQKQQLKQQQKQLKQAEKEAAAQSFEPGVPVTRLDEEEEKEREEEASHQADRIIEDATEQAAAMLEDAREQIEISRQSAREEGLQQGREEGLAAGQEELAQLRAEFEEEKEKQRQEYEKLLADVEPRYVGVLCSLVEKLTGVVISEHQDVLLHLVRSTFSDLEPAKHYILRVAPEDMALMERHKDEFQMYLGADTVLELQEEKGLKRYQCIVETDTQMVDCGFQTQLENLITTLRMLA